MAMGTEDGSSGKASEEPEGAESEISEETQSEQAAPAGVKLEAIMNQAHLTRHNHTTSRSRHYTTCLLYTSPSPRD